MPRFAVAAGLIVASSASLAFVGPVSADARQEACKKAMNDRIQVCTEACTRAALAAASDYVDTNNNVKFGCLKGCAIRQIFQMKACTTGQAAPPDDPTETNR